MKKIVAIALTLILVLSLAACGGSESASSVKLDVAQVYEKLTQTATLPEMLELDESLMLDYCGIKAEDVKAAKVAICADSLRTDEIWVIDAKDAAAAKTIADLAQKRLTKKGEESITYSPEQYAVVEKAELIQTGNSLVLIVSPDVELLAAAVRQMAGI